ncbi:hypothetical protein KCP78_18655 [Salmonella enterica subsp. enterica]|nr:hypothetical protein KCP78_18655 [Salmonella enterica subsp. enterica]
MRFRWQICSSSSSTLSAPHFTTALQLRDVRRNYDNQRRSVKRKLLCQRSRIGNAISPLA